ncbi:MAG: HEPN domain-containing protein [Thaumarchaeota archaeon]|jgi:HEPN domain-containing protein|nr:HEPN domain-containing protein [Candidatus Geocrenenecus arthurdayi]
MNSLAQDYLRRAEARLAFARYALDQGYYPEVVRYSQECVELSLKACLRLVGVEYPKVHDVSEILKAESTRFPDWFREKIDKLAEISRDLAEKRAPSMYGVEVTGKPPEELFNKDDALKALEDAELVYKLARSLLEQTKSNEY